MRVVLSNDGKHFSPFSASHPLWEEWHPKDDKSLGQKGENDPTFLNWINENKERWKKELEGCPFTVSDIKENKDEVEMIVRFHPLKKYAKWKSPVTTPEPLPDQIDLDKMLEEKELHIVKAFFVVCDGRKRKSGRHGIVWGLLGAILAALSSLYGILMGVLLFSE